MEDDREIVRIMLLIGYDTVNRQLTQVSMINGMCTPTTAWLQTDIMTEKDIALGFSNMGRSSEASSAIAHKRSKHLYPLSISPEQLCTVIGKQRFFVVMRDATVGVNDADVVAGAAGKGKLPGLTSIE